VQARKAATSVAARSTAAVKVVAKAGLRGAVLLKCRVTVAAGFSRWRKAATAALAAVAAAADEKRFKAVLEKEEAK